MPKEYIQSNSLFTRSFIALITANLLLFSAFYVVLTALSPYLDQELHVNHVISGLILALYTLAGLFFRPFAGFLSDLYKGKTFYLFSLFLFVLCFVGYMYKGGVLYLLVLRVIHGITFSLVTTVATTCVLEIVPREKLGTGLGFFGVSAAFSMAIGPPLGYFVLERGTFDDVFLLSVLIASAALLVGFCMKPIYAERPKSIKLTLGNLFLPAVKKPFLAFIGTVFPYGLLLVYLPLLIKEKNIAANTGQLFFAIAAGLTISRFFSGRLIDGGRLRQAILVASIISILGYFSFYASNSILVFFVAAFFVGVGNGTVTPAYQTVFATLVPPTQRGRASSLFFAAFDLGVGFAMLCGGIISHYSNLSYAFLIGTILLLFSLLYFVGKVWPFYCTQATQDT